MARVRRRTAVLAAAALAVFFLVAASTWGTAPLAIREMAGRQRATAVPTLPPLTTDVHAFYYAWYGNPDVDGAYLHWNHVRLPHWNQQIRDRHRQDAHTPPDDIGASFYPALGPYSSKDRWVISEHMNQLRQAGVGVLAVSWYSPDRADPNRVAVRRTQGQSPDPIVPLLLDAAAVAGLKVRQCDVGAEPHCVGKRLTGAHAVFIMPPTNQVCLHLEPYEGRSAASVRSELEYIVRSYGQHPAFYRMSPPDGGPRGLPNTAALPLYYVYDSYQTPTHEWQRLLQPSGDLTVRNTPLDGVFIGLLVTPQHVEELVHAGFDGGYSYFASHGFTYGSRLENWPKLVQRMKEADRIFIPSIGPGYNDEAVRPWNSENTKDRQTGQYYVTSFTAAANSGAPIISITSFNEWHEGTQIEKAVPKTIAGGYRYSDYGSLGPEGYLDLTRELIERWRDLRGTY